ncbi:hypothetical protein FGO68_gene5184 [Halteria grandinella]|uniref:Secreted protein n=1 Tax=Halteria grandinella TaxID=5974 RepID=A0A8J8NR01_HALGN|nr:hypothetical protein FGO68_gene5184 [Halteria grandinella]
MSKFIISIFSLALLISITLGAKTTATNATTTNSTNQTATVTRNYTCNIKLFEYDEVNWKNLSYGLIQGLYINPPKGNNCTACKNFSADMASINRGYVALEVSADLWTNFNTLISQSPLKYSRPCPPKTPKSPSPKPSQTTSPN